MRTRVGHWLGGRRIYEDPLCLAPEESLLSGKGVLGILH